MPPLWLLAFFGFFSGDVLIAGFALEIMPTRYRATVSGLRYLVEISAGAVSLALEGRLYDHFHAHGPAIQMLLAAIPITLVAILFLPEPAGKTLEEMEPEAPSVKSIVIALISSASPSFALVLAAASLSPALQHGARSTWRNGSMRWRRKVKPAALKRRH